MVVILFLIVFDTCCAAASNKQKLHAQQESVALTAAQHFFEYLGLYVFETIILAFAC